MPFTFGGVVHSAVPPNYNTLTNTITSTVVNETYSINYNYIIENIDTVPRTIECQWLYNSTPINYSGVITIAAGGTFTYSGSFTRIMTITGDTLVAQFKSDDATGTKVRQEESGTTVTSTVIFSQSISAVTTNTFLQH